MARNSKKPAPPTGPVQEYPVLTVMLHDGETYQPDDHVVLSPEAAAPLIALGVLGEAIPEAPAA
jgi:hypothetical protein